MIASTLLHGYEDDKKHVCKVINPKPDTVSPQELCIIVIVIIVILYEAIRFTGKNTI